MITAVRLMIKKKARSLKSLQRTNTERYQAEIRAYEPVAHHDHPKADCLVTLENEVYGANGATVRKQ